ncbi:MAG: PLP-dependent transferase, partial [Pyramidobacter sp.]|nr:PLP-dependent transferase [Pyramidobacter sp.]
GGFSGMIAFDINGDEKVHQKFLDSLKLITHAVSLGDIESLIVYYDKHSDKLPHYPPIYREGFFRFSIGLEDPADLIADLSAALDASGAPKK